MSSKRYIGILCLVFLFAAVGCSPKKTEKPDMPAEAYTDVPDDVAALGAVEAPAPSEPILEAAVPAAPPIPEHPAVGEPVPAAPVSEAPVAQPAPVAVVEPVRAEGDVIIADFETWPNNLGGEIGVFGSLEPDWEKVNQQPVSWVYEETSLNYSLNNVHSGKSSFLLINGVGIKPEYTWGSFAMDLGPVSDITVVPKKVESFDASGYKYITFWVKGAKGGEKMELLVRDAHASNYSPQVKYKLPDATAAWQKITIPLDDFSGKIDMARLDNVGISFGQDAGNMTGDAVYLDDFAFTNNP